jgi:hypothetical protein
MNLKIMNERLTRLIGRFGADAMEARQVAMRLNTLLPSRFRDIKRTHGGGATAERRALTDPRYLEYLEELANVSCQATEARIQYETHAMLFKARQSLRAFRSVPVPGQGCGSAK